LLCGAFHICVRSAACSNLALVYYFLSKHWELDNDPVYDTRDCAQHVVGVDRSVKANGIHLNSALEHSSDTSSHASTEHLPCLGLQYVDM
jgi:hypothetical protein